MFVGQFNPISTSLNEKKLDFSVNFKTFLNFVFYVNQSVLEDTGI